MDNNVDSPTASSSADGGNPYAPPAGSTVARPELLPIGGIPWLVFLGLGGFAGVFFWLFWSLFMAILMGQEFLRILAGPGAAAGLFFGIVFGVLMAVVMRPVATTLTYTDEGDFIPRLDAELGKLRYRFQGQDGSVRCYGPRTLVRPQAYKVRVRVEAGQALLEGPKTIIKSLSKALGQEPA